MSEFEHNIKLSPVLSESNTSKSLVSRSDNDMSHKVFLSGLREFFPTGNSTYTSCQMSSEDIVNTHDTFMKSLGIELPDDDKRLPYLYWTPKLHKSPVKHCYIAGSSKCTTKQLPSLLTKILTIIKTGLEKYCSIKTSHTGVNNMWIRKNSTNLLSSLSHLGVHRATSIQTFDFSTLHFHPT